MALGRLWLAPGRLWLVPSLWLRESLLGIPCGPGSSAALGRLWLALSLWLGEGLLGFPCGTVSSAPFWPQVHRHASATRALVKPGPQTGKVKA